MSSHAVDLVVQLRAEVARQLARGTEMDPAGRSVADVLERFGSILSPMHADTGDSPTPEWFVVSGLAVDRAEALAGELRELAPVLSAYVQPRPSPA